MALRNWFLSITVGGLIGGSGLAAESTAATPVARPPAFSFGILKATSSDSAKATMQAWLESAKKFDAKKFAEIWTPDTPVADAVIASVYLAHPEFQATLAGAKNAFLPAPTETPALLKDAKLDPFVRANVAAAYAKALAGRRVYEESLEAIKGIAVEKVVDPASFYFYKAVAEHALMQREAALTSLARLLDDVVDAPDRYRVTATLLFFDLQSWAKDPKDLTNIERLMDNSGRRLDLARAGKHTQDIQKKIVFRLDEKIKQLEAQANSQSQQANGGQCPSGGQMPGNGGSNQPSGPMADSNIATNGGPGQVDEKKLRDYQKIWGTLPESERKKIVLEMTRDLPPKYQETIESYFKSLNRLNGFQP